jgi:hypothetical protein
MTAGREIWEAVDRLVDRAAELSDLRTHRIHLLAARRWRLLGRAIPDELAHDQRRAAVAALTAPVVLGRVRGAYDGPLVVLKGPEIAARYPDAALRPYNDLDLLVPDPAEAQRALLAAGFVPIGNPRLYVNIHHERPLAAPGLPLHVELHSVAKWPERLTPPPAAELFEAAEPSVLGVAGVSTLARPHHALVLAAHSWAHDPLRRVGELVDIAAMSAGVDSHELDALAARWGLRRLWRTSSAAADALLGDGPATWPLRLWARHLPRVRDRTVLESHLDRWLSGFWALPPRPAIGACASAVAAELRPAPGEPVATKLARTRLALRNALVRRSDHAEELERAGTRGPFFHELERADEGAPGNERRARRN